MVGACCGPPSGWLRPYRGGRPGAGRRWRGYLLTELLVVFLLVSDRLSVVSLMHLCRRPHGIWAALVVPRAGRAGRHGQWVGALPAGRCGRGVVEAVSAYFRDLQAAGRSEATVRSYGMDLLRWFRFLWAVEVAWDRATRVEARDFCRWMLVAGKPSRPHWRSRTSGGARPVVDRGGLCAVGAGALRDGAARFLRLPSRGGQRADRQPVPAGSVAAGRPGARASQSDGAAPQRAHRAVSADGAVAGSRAASPTRSSTRSSPGCPRTGTGRWSPSTSRPARGRRSCCRPRGAGWTRAGS